MNQFTITTIGWIFGGAARRLSSCLLCAVVACTAHSSMPWPAYRGSTYCLSHHGRLQVFKRVTRVVKFTPWLLITTVSQSVESNGVSRPATALTLCTIILFRDRRLTLLEDHLQIIISSTPPLSTWRDIHYSLRPLAHDFTFFRIDQLHFVLVINYMNTMLCKYIGCLWHYKYLQLYFTSTLKLSVSAIWHVMCTFSVNSLIFSSLRYTCYYLLILWSVEIVFDVLWVYKYYYY